MELKKFIKSTLIDICEAIDEAKKASIETAAIAPGTVKGKPVDKGQLVSFDIMVTASNSAQGEGKGKIEVLALGANLDGKVSSEKENTNRIQFQVPVYFSGRMDKNSL